MDVSEVVFHYALYSNVFIKNRVKDLGVNQDDGRWNNLMKLSWWQLNWINNDLQIIYKKLSYKIQIWNKLH